MNADKVCKDMIVSLEMNMSCKEKEALDKNLELLKRRDATLAKRLLELEADPRLSLVETKEGVPTLLWDDGSGKSKPLHNPRAPLREARRSAESHVLEEETTLIVQGFGLGYEVLELHRLLQDQLDSIIIVDASPTALLFALRNPAMAELLSDPKVQWSIDEPLIDLRYRVQNMVGTILASGISFFIHPRIQPVFADYFAQAHEEIITGFRQGKTNAVTMIADGQRFLNNIITNLPSFVATQGVIQLKDVLTGVPAVIVAAGPSLDKNIDLLANMRDRVLIIAVDTSYRILLQRGIVPHFLVSVDARPASLKHFEGVSHNPQTRFLYDPEICPEVLRSVPLKSYCSGQEISNILYWVQEHTEVKGTLRKAGSVSLVAFYLARGMGCSPLIFIGQDLSYPKNAPSTHAKGAALSQSVMPQLGWDGVHEIDGYHGDKVVTIHNMLTYLRALEDDVNATDAPVVNATEGGARIAGTIQMTLSEAIDAYAIKPHDAEEKLAKVDSLHNPPSSQTVKQLFTRMSEVYTTGVEISEKAIERLERAIECKVSGGSYQQVVVEAQEAFKQLQNHPILKESFERSIAAETLRFNRTSRTKGEDYLKRYLNIFSACLQSSLHYQEITYKLCNL
jgi:hypothetical protein